MAGDAARPATGSPVRRALANFSRLISGRAAAGVLSVVGVTVAARLLGAEAFGVLILTHTTAVVARGLLNFKPSDTVVNFGVEPFDARDAERLERLLAFTLSLDVGTAVGAAAVTFVILAFAAPAVGLPDDLAFAAPLYAAALVCAGSGSSMGVLRLADRFGAIALQEAVGPLVRLIGIGLAWWLEAGLAGFVMAWSFSLLLEHLYLNCRGFLELRRRGFRLPAPSWSAAHEFRGIKPFVWVLYWQSNLELAQRHGLTLVVGGLAGAAAAGIYRLAREFADVLAKPVVVVRQAVFPDLARLWRDRDPRFVTLYRRLGFLGGAVAVLVVLVAAAFGERLLVLAAGPDFGVGAGLLTGLMAAAALELVGAALRPAAYAMGSARGALRVQLAATAALFAVLWPLLTSLGLTGAGVAVAVGAAVTFAGMVVIVRAHGLPPAAPEVRGD